MVYFVTSILKLYNPEEFPYKMDKNCLKCQDKIPLRTKEIGAQKKCYFGNKKSDSAGVEHSDM